MIYACFVVIYALFEVLCGEQLNWRLHCEKITNTRFTILKILQPLPQYSLSLKRRPVSALGWWSASSLTTRVLKVGGEKSTYVMPHRKINEMKTFFWLWSWQWSRISWPHHHLCIQHISSPPCFRLLIWYICLLKPLFIALKDDNIDLLN